jgi:EmrB/QacA subfamily drug resistance transporter
MVPGAAGIELRSGRGRGVLLAVVLGSGMAFLDGTVVNVALPVLGRELGVSLAGLQWTVDAYLLTLTAFLLIGGSLGDALGRRRIFVLGAVAFAATSVLCGFASTLAVLCLARALQGVAGALLVPGSLAILRSSLRSEDEDAAIGAWAGLSGVTTAAGPIVGGWLVEAWSWRAIFFLNLPLALAVVWTGLRSIPADAGKRGRIDWPGAALAALGLGGVVYALIEGPGRSWPAWICGVAGLAVMSAFLLWERRAPAPMLPLALFRSRQFAAANLTTLAVYCALSAATFLVVLELQRGLGYTPLASGLVLTPMMVAMLVLSPAVGRLAHRIGYRIPMTIGPLCAGLGLAIVAQAGLSRRGLASFVAGILVFAMGLGTTVAPLTAAVMTGVGEHDAGVASAVNNAVARLAGLLGIAILPGLAGVSASGTAGLPFMRAVRGALLASAAVCAAGGAIAWIALPRGSGVLAGRPRATAVAVTGPPRCW